MVLKCCSTASGDEGAVQARRRPGTVIILEDESMDAMQERMNTLPFVAEGLMTLLYEEVYEI